MKVLIGIPTRGRQTAPILARQLARYGDVVIVAQETNLPKSQDYSVIEQPPGLRRARNTIFGEAINNKYEAVVQCDDDLEFRPEVLDAYFDLIYELLPAGVASVCSKPRIYEFWDGPCRSNKTYEIIPRLQQCWAIRTDVVKDIGMIELETLEDVEYALRLVHRGYISSQISVRKITHNHKIKRDKDGCQGGQPLTERLNYLDNAIKVINERYDFAVVRRKDEGSFSCKLDWSKIRAKIPYLGLGYEDERGIRA